MKVQRLLPILMGLFLGLQSSAAPAVSADDKKILAQLEQIKTHLKTSTTATGSCETPQDHDCTLQSYCSKFDNKGRDFYIYQNEEGRQVPNFQMISYLSATDACLGKSNKNPLVNDPFAYPNQLTDPAVAGSPAQLHKNYVRYEDQQARTRKIFDDVKERIVKLLSSRRTSENAAATDNMIARITAVGFNFPKGNNALSDLAKEGCEMPNAFYNPGTHQVTICPQMMNLPESALFSVFSHELGHSIDPCQSAMHYTRSERGISSERPFTSFQGQEYIFKGISPAQNPFKEVITCLQKPESIGAVIPTLEQSLKNGEQRIINQRGNSGNYAGIDISLKDEERAIRQEYSSYNGCMEVTGNGHMQEAFSDWIASQTLKQKASEIQESSKAQQYAFESQSFYMGVGCQNLNQTAVAYLRPLIRNKCPELLKKMESADLPKEEGKSHPATPARVNRIMFASPEMQKALGCKKDDGLVECR